MKNKRDLYEKYVASERNRMSDFVKRTLIDLRRIFPNIINVYEDLVKEDLVGERNAKKA